MIKLKTKYKIFVASLIRLPIVFFLKILKKSNNVIVNRNGLVWSLHLNEGIDFSIFLTGKFEYDISDFLKKNINENDVIFDIGANIGAHTLPIANLVGKYGKVYAFEPTYYAYEKLKKNINLNSNLKKRIVINQIMLAEKENSKNVSALYSSWPLGFEKHRHPIHFGNLRSTKGYKSQTLDRYVNINKITNVKLVKIDVDGFEIKVLIGGKNFFKKQKPLILIELAPYTFRESNQKFSTLINLLNRMNYKLFLIEKNIKLPNSSKLIEKLIPKGGSINVIGKCL